MSMYSNSILGEEKSILYIDIRKKEMKFIDLKRIISWLLKKEIHLHCCAKIAGHLFLNIHIKASNL